MFGSRGSAGQRMGRWHLEVTEASPTPLFDEFYDDFAADTSTTGTVDVEGMVVVEAMVVVEGMLVVDEVELVGGSVSGEIEFDSELVQRR